MADARDAAAKLLERLAVDPLECEADWTKIRSLEFVEMLQERASLLQKRMKISTCQECDEFDEHVRSV